MLWYKFVYWWLNVFLVILWNVMNYLIFEFCVGIFVLKFFFLFVYLIYVYYMYYLIFLNIYYIEGCYFKEFIKL